MVRHCPRCELRFPSEGEVIEHLSVDHDADVRVFERFRYPEQRPREPLYADLGEPSAAPRRYLVVANQTLGSRALQAEVVRRIEEGPAEVVVLVPATHSADYPTGPAEGPSDEVRPAPDEPGLAQARWRLRTTVEGLRRAGASVYGQLGPADPYEAAGAMLEQEPFDEVIMSTLSPEISRWLAMDVPARIRRRLGIPVTVVSADRADVAPAPMPEEAASQGEPVP